MDNQQPIATQAPTPVSPPMPTPIPPGSTAPKRDITPWIVIFLFLCAIIVTVSVYFFLPKSKIKQNEQTPTGTSTQKSNPKENAKWQVYNNTKYGYSFFYPVTWKIANIKPDQKSLELQYADNARPAKITIQYITPEERKKLQPTFCQTNDEKNRCVRYWITEKNDAVIDLSPQKNSGKDEEALISHPDGGMLIMQITTSNAESSKTFGTLIYTLSFSNEKRLHLLQICPDTWPTTEKTADYNGVKIPTDDIDASWIKNNCKYSQ